MGEGKATTQKRTILPRFLWTYFLSFRGIAVSPLKHLSARIQALPEGLHHNHIKQSSRAVGRNRQRGYHRGRNPPVSLASQPSAPFHRQMFSHEKYARIQLIRWAMCHGMMGNIQSELTDTHKAEFHLPKCDEMA
jgi:hypothetical protein